MSSDSGDFWLKYWTYFSSPPRSNQLINIYFIAIIILCELTPCHQNPKVHHHIYNSPPPAPILSQLDPLYTPLASLHKIHSNSNLPHTTWSSNLLAFPSKPPLFSHACHTSCPPHFPWFDLPNNITWRVQIIEHALCLPLSEVQIFLSALCSHNLVVVHVGGVRLCPNCGNQRAYWSSSRLYISMEPRWNDTGRGRPKYLEKNLSVSLCPP
jgi:hypothetical protein